MENGEISSDEFDLESSSEDSVQMPIGMAITPVIISHLHKITEEQWEMLATAHTDTDTIRLLLGLCEDIVETITSMVGDTLLPRVYTRMRESSNTSTSMNEIDEPETDWSYYIMTEEVMEILIGDSLHACLGAVIGVVEKSSHNSDKLLELVAAEATRRVNHSLAEILPSTFFPQSHQTAGSDISLESLDDMVYHAAQILHRCFWEKKQPEEESQFSELSELSGPDDVSDIEDFSDEDAEAIWPSYKCSAGTFEIIKASPSPVVDVSQKENFSTQKSTRRINTFVKKVTVCEVVQLENGSTPQSPKVKKKKRLSILRIFSSLARILTKPFTSCISGESQDD